MIDMSPLDNITRDPHVNYNFLSTVNQFQELMSVNIDFACISDQPDSLHHLFLRCYTGDLNFLNGFNESPTVWVREICV